jgi:hypothetical protein
MTLDTIDQAFVTRWEARKTRGASAEDVVPPEPIAVIADEESAAVATDHVGTVPLPDPEPVAAVPVEESLVDRLLTAGHEQWECLADEIEVARRDGHRVIAVVGGEPGEGRSTLVDCLAQTLRERGRDVHVLASPDDAATGEGGQGHDKRIVLIDAGIWFPPGPIRRQRLVQESVGCDAAILVRRADREPVAARATALAALGMTVLGEVVTFASPDGDDR